MNYGEMRNLFHGILNRNDCDDDLADTFISLGLRRTERLLRTPLQETRIIGIIQPDWMGWMLVPQNFLGLKEVRRNGKVIDRVTTRQSENHRGFGIKNGAFFFYPDLKEGEEFEIVYYSEFLTHADEEDITRYSLTLPDLITYSALSFAGDYFVDERKATWNETYAALISEVEMMDSITEMEGGLFISPIGEGYI